MAIPLLDATAAMFVAVVKGLANARQPRWPITVSCKVTCPDIVLYPEPAIMAAPGAIVKNPPVANVPDY